MEIKNHDLAELKKKVDEAYRTDHLTLPNIPKGQDPERDAESDAERELILNPAHPANVEVRKRLVEGRLPSDAPAEALASIGKHKITISENETAIIEKPEIKVENNIEVVIDREGLPVPVVTLEEKAVDDKASPEEKSVINTEGGQESVITDHKPTDFTSLIPKKR